MKFYGLRNRHTKIPLSWAYESGYDDEDGNNVAFYLYNDRDPDRVWLVRPRELAEEVLTRDEDVEWYNSGYDAPLRRHLLQRNYEVFEVEI